MLLDGVIVVIVLFWKPKGPWDTGHKGLLLFCLPPNLGCLEDRVVTQASEESSNFRGFFITFLPTLGAQARGA